MGILDHAKEAMLPSSKVGPIKRAQASATGGARAVSSLVLQVDDLAKRYGATVALEDVSFSLNAGEVCGLLGENGAGKSTLVKALSGVVAPDHGEIRLKGDRFRPTSIVDANRLGVSTAFQELSLVPSLSVATNLALPDVPKNAIGLVSGRELRRRAEATLAQWGAADIRPSDIVDSLPLGVRQRVRDHSGARPQSLGIAARRAHLGPI